MAMKTKREVLEAGMNFAKKCQELEDRYDIDLMFLDCELRVQDQAITMSMLLECENTEKAEQMTWTANYTVEELVDSKYVDGVIQCEGELWETLYHYEGFGDTSRYGKEVTGTVYSELCKGLQSYGFDLNLSDTGRIILQCRESWEEEFKGE